MRRSVAILGGDMRQVHLARLLLADGWKVLTWGLEQGAGPNPAPLDLAISQDLLIFPLPVCRGGELNLPLTDTKLPIATVWPRLCADQLLLGGMAGDLLGRLQAEYGLTMVDYYDREELQVTNAQLTAEGAIQRAMEETDFALHGSKCLVIGFGRIGKILARTLQSLGAQVTVSGRKYADMAWAQSLGFQWAWTDRLDQSLEQTDILFNTVPSPVLDRILLQRLQKDCLLLELASRPGGIDETAARQLKLRLLQAPGLPGAAAPRSAAAAIRDSIYHILEERGEPI